MKAPRGAVIILHRKTKADRMTPGGKPIRGTATELM
jgi:hypothetical protein